VLAVWRQMVILYEDGTPRTRHVITNPIIEVDEEAGTATCRSVYTVLQQVPGDALRIVINGRYHDRFVRDEGGTWHYAWRDYSLHDFPGDMSRHTRNPAWEKKA
jgi:3-phenylpropionate/cinnamic acid dioxygenase small subunit